MAGNSLTQTLVTKAQLNEVYSSMNLDSGAEAIEVENDLEEATWSDTAGERLVPTTPVVPPAALGKRKVRSSQTSNEKTRERRDVRRGIKPLTSKQVLSMLLPEKVVMMT